VQAAQAELGPQVTHRSPGMSTALVRGVPKVYSPCVSKSTRKTSQEVWIQTDPWESAAYLMAFTSQALLQPYIPHAGFMPLCSSAAF